MMNNESVRSLGTRRSMLVATALSLLFVALLYLENRPWLCDLGFALWSGAWSRCTSQQIADPYTLTHVLHGIFFYWLLWPLAARIPLRWRLVGALALEIAWEVLENSPWVVERYRQDTAALEYTGDSIVNALGDVVAMTLGFALASQFSWKTCIIVFFVVELGLLYFIRDNLTLNVLMLLFPLDSLKAWQLGAAG